MLGLETPILSIILSTAMFDGAQANTLFFCNSTALTISSTTVVVFPVPGGPWIKETSEEANEFFIASYWESLRFLFVKEMFSN